MEPDELMTHFTARQQHLEAIAQSRSAIKDIDAAIEDIINVEGLFTNSEKTHGEFTTEVGPLKVTIKKNKKIKYDNDLMVGAGALLNWEEASNFFKIKFDMGEKEFKNLEAAALDSEKFSDVLSRVEDAREVTIDAPKLTKIELVGAV